MTAHAPVGSATLVYVYAVAASESAQWVAREKPVGLEGRPLRAIEEGDLAALASDVPFEDYEQSALDEHVRSPEWLTPRATAHQDVNAAAHGALDAVLPVPFATIFTSEDRVREMLRTRTEELRAKLISVRGQAEWVVGLHRDQAAATAHLSKVGEAIAPRDSAAAPGRRYLEDKRSELSRRGELHGLDRAAAASAHEMFARVSRHSFEEPVVQDAGDLLARTTYLVRREDEHRFADVVDRFNSDWASRGYEVRLTGPWPPYRSSGGAA